MGLSLALIGPGRSSTLAIRPEALLFRGRAREVKQPETM